MIGLYRDCMNLGALPRRGGVLDQDAKHMAYFSVFGAAEAEYFAPKG